MLTIVDMLEAKSWPIFVFKSYSNCGNRGKQDISLQLCFLCVSFHVSTIRNRCGSISSRIFISRSVTNTICESKPSVSLRNRCYVKIELTTSRM